MISSQWISSLLRGTPLSTGQQMELRAGQVFKGTILKLFPDNFALVQVGGMTLTAKLEARLEAGQQTWLQVQPGSNPVTLKVLRQPEQPEEVADGSAAGLLKSLGVKPSTENQALVERFLSEKIPVNPKLLLSLASLIQEIGGTAQDIEAGILAIQRGLPLSKEVVTSLKTYLFEPPLNQLVQSFVQEAQNLLQLQQQPPEQQLPQSQRSQQPMIEPFVRQIVDMLKPLQQELQSTEPDLVRQFDIKQILKSLGFHHEKSLQEGIPQENLKSLLIQMLRSETSTQLSAPFVEKADTILKNITAQQLLLTSTSDQPLINFALQLPVQLGNTQPSLLIQFESRNKGRGELDADNCRLFFYLNLENLGEIMADVQIVNKIMGIRLFNDHPLIPSLLSQMKESLSQSVEALGYQLSYLQAAKIPSSTTDPTGVAKRPTLPSYQSLQHYRGVDIRI